ncbi:uncharacterized protein BJX67DRAFT_366080 [Aspergillus lucknowensis]|uniref:GPI anchored protein n=1 Tax=Aspergillus lucknowensis TaxID=176173 RepID=A0ABR4LDG9_9EURO
MRATLLTLTLAALTLADDATTTVGVFGGGNDLEDLDDFEIPFYASTGASVVSVNALETTYEVACLDSAPTESCSIKDPWSIVQAISTFSLSAEYTALDWNPPVTATLDYGCTYTNYTLSATCTYSVSYSGSSDGQETSSSFSTETSWPADQVTYYELYVTGGVDKFDEPEATETPGAAAAGGFGGPVQAMITAAPVLAAGVAAWL